jgi:HAD superfamily hydrolase (TIGR01509 family)
MDGVLVDSEPEYKRLEAELALSVGVTLSDEDMKDNVGKGQPAMWKDLKKKYGFEADPLDLMAEEARLARRFYEHDRLKGIEPAIDLLKRCARDGLKIAIATSSLEENAKLAVKGLELEAYVGAIAGGDKVERSKPAPDIFLLAAKLLGTAPEECVVIEDSGNGVFAAKEAGMKAVGVKASDSDQDLSGADIVVETLEEMRIECLRSLF